MKKIKSIVLFLLLPIVSLWAGEAPTEPHAAQGVIGGGIVLKTDFDIYRIRHGDKKPYLYSYMIMPAPEVGIGGRFYTYLGRMPAGTVLEIVSFGSSKMRRGGEYQARPLFPIDDKIKRNTLRKAHEIEGGLNGQLFKLRGMEQGLKVYTKERYSDGFPKLNEAWFEIIDRKDIGNDRTNLKYSIKEQRQIVSPASEIRQELPVGTSFVIATDFWVYKIKGQMLRKGLPRVKDNNYTMDSGKRGGMGGWHLEYQTTFLAGTRFEVVSLIKKNNRKWFYIVKTKGYTDPKIGEATVVINPASMLKVSWGRRQLDGEHINTKTTQLAPALFTDFHYPAE